MFSKEKQEIIDKIKEINPNVNENNYIGVPMEKMELILNNMLGKEEEFEELIDVDKKEEKLEEKASIDWNNYLTQDEVHKFLSKDDKDKGAEEIINSKDFEKRYKDFHNDLQKKYNNSWTKKELINDLVEFYKNGHLITKSKLNENYVLKGSENGNGFDIAYNSNLSKLEQFMEEMQNAHPNIEMWIEENNKLNESYMFNRKWTALTESNDNNTGTVTGYRSIGLDELKILLQGETVKGKFIGSNEEFTNINDSNKVYFYKDPIMWKDREHKVMIECQFSKKDTIEGIGEYRADKGITTKGTWNGRWGNNLYKLDEFVVDEYNIENVISFVNPKDTLKIIEKNLPELKDTFINLNKNGMDLKDIHKNIQPYKTYYTYMIWCEVYDNKVNGRIYKWYYKTEMFTSNQAEVLEKVMIAFTNKDDAEEIEKLADEYNDKGIKPEDIKDKIVTEEQLEEFLKKNNLEESLEEQNNNKLEESSNTLILYHNTTNENAIKIDKEGIIPGLRKSVYGKGSEAEGSGIWCSTERGYGYGGATITFEIDKDDEALEKQNDTEYMVFRKIEPNEIVDIDLVVSKIVINKLPSITESVIPLAIEKYGKEKLYSVFEKYSHNFVSPYNMEQLKHLVETGEKYCKGKIQLTESKHKIEEVSRNELLVKAKGETISRYNRASGYKGFYITNIDTTDILRGNSLIVTCRVGRYDDTVQLEDILYWVQIVAEMNKDRQINTKGVTQAIMNSIDGMDINVDCTCMDWKCRFAYNATVWGFKYGKPETRPAKIRNPNGFGAICKHLIALLSNKKWLQQVTGTLMDYIVKNIDAVNEFLELKDDKVLTLPNELARQNAKSGFYTKFVNRQELLDDIISNYMTDRKDYIDRADIFHIKNDLADYVENNYAGADLKPNEIDYVLKAIDKDRKADEEEFEELVDVDKEEPKDEE